MVGYYDQPCRTVSEGRSARVSQEAFEYGCRNLGDVSDQQHEYNIQFVSSVRGVVDLDLDVVVVVTDDVVVSETYANRLDISNHTNMRIRK